LSSLSCDDGIKGDMKRSAAERLMDENVCASNPQTTTQEEHGICHGRFVWKIILSSRDFTGWLLKDRMMARM
jgi:hypothetical protein